MTRRTSLTDAVLDKPTELDVTGWNGNAVHCVYLNGFRIAGGKPWAGGRSTKVWNNVTLREVIRAFPDLQKALGFDYLGNRLEKAKAP